MVNVHFKIPLQHLISKHWYCKNTWVTHTCSCSVLPFAARLIALAMTIPVCFGLESSSFLENIFSTSIFSTVKLSEIPSLDNTFFGNRLNSVLPTNSLSHGTWLIDLSTILQDVVVDIYLIRCTKNGLFIRQEYDLLEYFIFIIVFNQNCSKNDAVLVNPYEKQKLLTLLSHDRTNL